MKKLSAFIILVLIDIICVDPVDVGAQVMIAPAVLAAIIGAVGSVLGGVLGNKPKEGGQLQQGKFEPPMKSGGGGMAGSESFDLPGIAGRSMGPMMSPDGGGGMRSTQPPDMPNYNQKLLRVDEGPAASLASTMDFQTVRDGGFRPITGSPPQRQSGGFDLGLTGGAGGTTSGREGMNLGQVDLSGGNSVTKKGGMDMDKTLQYAAMAATLGSLLNAGGPPRPPSLPGAGSFNAQPTSMRFLYGG
jgi:hypothetical protein